MTNMQARLFVLASLFLNIQLFAQESVQSKYDPNELFNPLFYKEYGNTLRTGNGEPGTAYWQNKADYSIKAELNDLTNEVRFRYHSIHK